MMAGADTLGILAGGGDLPSQVAAAARSRGIAVAVAALDGCADAARFPGCTVSAFSIAQVGGILKFMRRCGVTRLVMAGDIARPDFSALKPDMRGLSLLPRVVAAARRGGDDAILSVIVEFLEGEGFTVTGADEILCADAVAPAGILGRCRPSPMARQDIARARALLAAISPFDIGQGAVVRHGRVLAVEGAEHTTAMLLRCAGFTDDQGGVLVKAPKAGQERRVDLPGIGPETVQAAAQARLEGIAFEAGGCLLINRGELVAQADRLGLFLYGFDPGGDDG